MHTTALPSTPLPLSSDQSSARDPLSAALQGFFSLLDDLGQANAANAVQELPAAERSESDQATADLPADATATASKENGTLSLKGRRIAILATDGFEPSELEAPRKALKKAGAQTELVSLKVGRIRGWAANRFSRGIAVDRTLDDARADDYDGLLLPGGVMNPDQLRMEPKAVAFTRDFFAARKPVAAICHAPQLLIEANVVRGRQLTSYPSVRVDLINAGANWVDAAVVVDRGLVTSRSPDDLPAFNAKMIEEFAEGRHPTAP